MDEQAQELWEQTLQYVADSASGLYPTAPEHWTADQVSMLEAVLYVPEVHEALRRWVGLQLAKLRASAEA